MVRAAAAWGTTRSHTPHPTAWSLDGAEEGSEEALVGGNHVNGEMPIKSLSGVYLWVMVANYNGGGYCGGWG